MQETNFNFVKNERLKNRKLDMECLNVYLNAITH